MKNKATQNDNFKGTFPKLDPHAINFAKFKKDVQRFKDQNKNNPSIEEWCDKELNRLKNEKL